MRLAENCRGAASHLQTTCTTLAYRRSGREHSLRSYPVRRISNEPHLPVSCLHSFSGAAMKRRSFKPSELTKIAGAEEFQHPDESRLRLGDIIQLNSGGPKM